MKRYLLAMVLVGACGGDHGDGQDGDAGSSTLDAASADAAPPPPCDCLPLESCPAEPGVCEVTPTLFVSVLNANPTTAQAFFCALGNGLGETTLAEAGSCRVAMMGSREVLSPVDVGVIELSVLGNPIELQATCGFQAIAPPAAGESIVLTGSGGSDVPAFELSAAMPSPPADLSAPTLVPGDDFVVTWTPGSGTDVSLYLTADDKVVRCYDFDDSGAITVPAELTEMLTGQPQQLILSSVARERVYGGNLVVELNVQAHSELQ